MVNPPETAGLPWPKRALQTQGLKLHQRIAGWFLVLLCGGVALGLLVLIFGFTDEGQDLVLESALSLGLGNRIEGAGIVPERCDYSGSSGRYSVSGYECDIVILRRAADGTIQRTKRAISVGRPAYADRAREAASLFGAIGVRWPLGVMASRWLQMLPLSFAFVIPAIGVVFAWHMLRNDRLQRRAATVGRMVAADLLYFVDNHWRFAWVDTKGRQRFGKAIGSGALVLDGLVTRGAALLAAGGRAWMIYANLYPLILTPDEATKVQDAAGAKRGTPRRRLPPLADEARTPEGRLEAIRTLLLSRGKHDTERAFELAWRLVWDFENVETATDACELRHQAAKRLGPKRALALLRSCRERWANG